LNAGSIALVEFRNNLRPGPTLKSHVAVMSSPPGTSLYATAALFAVKADVTAATSIYCSCAVVKVNAAVAPPGGVDGGVPVMASCCCGRTSWSLLLLERDLLARL